MDISEITVDINKFCDAIDRCKNNDEYINSLTSVIVSKKKELDIITERINSDRKIHNELSVKINKMRTDISNYNNQIKSLETKKESIFIDEDKVNALSHKKNDLEESIEILKSEINIIKTDRDIILGEIKNINDDIEIKKNEYSTLEISTSLEQKRLNELDHKVSDISFKLKKLIEEDGEVRQQILKNKSENSNILSDTIKLKDEIINKKSELSNIECRKKNEEENIKDLKSQIAELNEIKDNIMHELSSARNKTQDTENRIIAIKKDIIRFIMENKNNNNKKKMAELMKEVEDA